MTLRNQIPGNEFAGGTLGNTALGHAVESFEKVERRIDDLAGEDGTDVATREEFLETMKKAQSINWTIRGALSQRYGMLNKVLDEMK